MSNELGSSTSSYLSSASTHHIDTGSKATTTQKVQDDSRILGHTVTPDQGGFTDGVRQSGVDVQGTIHKNGTEASLKPVLKRLPNFNAGSAKIELDTETGKVARKSIDRFVETLNDPASVMASTPKKDDKSLESIEIKDSSSHTETGIRENLEASHPMEVDEIEDVRQHPVMQTFVNDPGPKILLVPEGHGSLETMNARNFVSEQETIHAFSEGETGLYYLGGLRGVETRADYDIAPLLKEFQSCQRKIAEGKDLHPSDLDTPEKVINELKKIGVSNKDIKLINKMFFKEKSAERRNQAITYFQNQRRDKNLVKLIAQECKTLCRDPDKKVGVCFLGATHLVEGYDDKNDHRTSNERIPQLLLKAGKQGDHCVRLHGVNVYIYPHVMISQESKDPYFEGFFEH